MGVTAGLLPRFEPAPENRMHPERMEVIRRYDAPGHALRPVADAQRSPGDLLSDERVEQRAAPPKIVEVRPGDFAEAGRPASRSCERKDRLLVGNGRVRAEQDSFDPTVNSGIGADPQGQAKNREKRKARAAPEHPEAKTEVLGPTFEPQAAPDLPRDL